MTVIEFLNAAVYRRSELRSPTLPNALEGYYAWGTDQMSRLSEAEQSALWEIPTKLQTEGSKPRVLFVRPRSQLFVRAAASTYEVLTLDPAGAKPIEQVEGIWKLPSIPWLQLLHETVIESKRGRWAAGQMLLNQITAFLVQVKPQIVVLNLDGHQLERAFAVVAKWLGIPVLSQQHGLFPELFPPVAREGDACDEMIVWSQHFVEYQLKSGFQSSNELHNLGYPYDLPELSPISHEEALKRGLLFLGQPFEEFGADFNQRKQSMLQNALDSCNELGIPFAYRKHPGESLASVADIIPADCIRPVEESLVQAFEQFGIHMSISSTAVVEAALCGRIALQIFDPIISLENFADYGGVHSCSALKDDIKKLLIQVQKGERGLDKIDPNYLCVVPDRAAKFVQVLNGMSNKQRRSKTGKGFDVLPSLKSDFLPAHWDLTKAQEENAPFAISLLSPCGQPSEQGFLVRDPRALRQAHADDQAAIDWLAAIQMALKAFDGIAFESFEASDAIVSDSPVWTEAIAAFEGLQNGSMVPLDIRAKWKRAVEHLHGITRNMAKEISDNENLIKAQRDRARHEASHTVALRKTISDYARDVANLDRIIADLNKANADVHGWLEERTQSLIETQAELEKLHAIIKSQHNMMVEKDRHFEELLASRDELSQDLERHLEAYRNLEAEIEAIKLTKLFKARESVSKLLRRG